VTGTPSRLANPPSARLDPSQTAGSLLAKPQSWRGFNARGCRAIGPVVPSVARTPARRRTTALIPNRIGDSVPVRGPLRQVPPRVPDLLGHRAPPIAIVAVLAIHGVVHVGAELPLLGGEFGAVHDVPLWSGWLRISTSQVVAAFVFPRRSYPARCSSRAAHTSQPAAGLGGRVGSGSVMGGSCVVCCKAFTL